MKQAGFHEKYEFAFLVVHITKSLLKVMIHFPGILRIHSPQHTTSIP